MNGNLLFAIGTVARWAGLFCVFRCAVLAGTRLLRPIGFDSVRNLSRLGSNAGAAAILLLLSLPLLGSQPLMTLPLIWPMMPFWGWLALVSVVMAGYTTVKGYMSYGMVDAPFPGKAIAGWLATAIFSFGLFKLGANVGLIFFGILKPDPNAKLTILQGGIPISLQTAAILILLAVATVAAMVASARYAAVRGFTKGTVTHVALVVGSVVFGLPFVWLAITSFKEDRDMSSPNGLVWIPKVQETRPYFDHANPLLEGTYQGLTVRATIEQTNPDGTLRVNVVRPQAIAGSTFSAPRTEFKEVAKDCNVFTATYQGQPVTALDVADESDGRMHLRVLEPASLKDQEFVALPSNTEPVRHVGLKWENYPGALEFLPLEAHYGLTYLQNTIVLVVLSVIGTLLSSSIVAYAFSRMRFPGREQLFALMISTMMLPAAVTMLPQFLIFRDLHMIDSLRPLWIPTFFGSAFNIFLLRQFFLNIPMELEDAAKIDGCSYLRTFWGVMVPQIKPALAVIGIWTFMGAWNNFMGPLIYVSSPEHMTISYAVQMFNTDRAGEPGFLMAFTTMAMLPVLALFFFAQRYFIEGVTLSGLGGR